MSIQIGGITIKGNLVLGPMAGVTDLPFRLLCKEQGADYIYTEMVSGKGILYQNKNTEALLEVKEEERPVALQLFGSEPAVLAEAAKKIEHRNFDVLDINMGCPVPKIVNNGEGSAFMRDPSFIEKIVSSVVKAVRKPVSVKIRKGFSLEEETAVEAAKAAEAGGASLIAVHGRTREQYYSGEADWSVIEKVKQNISIPVIGNGDIRTPYDAERMQKQTGCDGVMIARGAQGNPWIFHQCKQYFQTGKIPEKPSVEELIGMLLRHCQMQLDWKGEYIGIREMRKHVAWYTAGYPQSSRLRARLNEINEKISLEMLLREWQQEIEEK